jgi:O-acetyl-ADP-ribose deacetylase (regulator of RNase III)
LPKGLKPEFSINPDINAKVSFWMQGDITQLAADAIVSPATPALSALTSTATKIHTAGGRDLTAECKKKGGSVQFGQVVQTVRGKLPAKCVLHAVAPPDDFKTLTTAITGALRFVDGSRIKTIGFPTIGDGRALVAAIREFLEDPDNRARVDRIVVVVDEWRDVKSYYHLIPEFFPVDVAEFGVPIGAIPTWAVAGPDYFALHPLPPEFRAKYAFDDEINARVSFWMRGDSSQLVCDAIVNAASEWLSPGGGICGVIHAAAGPELAKECRKRGRCPTGKAALTHGFNLPAKYVIHAVGPTRQDPVALKSAYVETLKYINGKDIRSVALCCISTGIFGYPIRPATHIALETVRKFLSDPGNRAKTDRIIFVVFKPSDVEVYYTLAPSYFPVTPDASPVPDSLDEPSLVTDSTESPSPVPDSLDGP